MTTFSYLAPNSLEKVPDELSKHFLTLKEGSSWVRFSVIGNGSCFYNSCAAALNYDNYLQHSVHSQEIIGKNLRKNFQRDITDENWNAFWKKKNLTHIAPCARIARKEVENPSTWANLWAIYAFSCWTKTNFIFYDFAKGGVPYCGVTLDPKNCDDDRPKNSNLPNSNWSVVFIAWTRNSHFDPIAVVHEKNSPICRFPKNRTDLGNSKCYKAAFQFRNDASKKILDHYNSGTCKNTSIQEAGEDNAEEHTIDKNL